MSRFTFTALATATLLVALPASAQTVLKFSHTDQQAGARHMAAQVFAKKVEEYTQGRYKVKVFCCSQLGNDPKNIEQLQLGGIDFTVSATGSYAPHVPTPEPDHAALPGRELRPGLEVLRRIESGCRRSSPRRRTRASASSPPGKPASAT
jgi:hypothetical protein